jgi:hypothetical protein
MRAWVWSLLTILILLIVLRVTMKAGRLPQNQLPL